MFERNEKPANTTSRTPQRRARETTLDGQGAVQDILWCSAGSKNYGDLGLLPGLVTRLTGSIPCPNTTG
ncbi:hypothetical protein ACLKA7_011557 [Drosophila subpalustris]